MDNHIHLLIEHSDIELDIIMKKIEVKFVRWYNKKYQRIGNLFQDRYKSEPVNDMRYFHREVSEDINIPISKIVNLTNVFGEDEETERFVTRYIRLSQYDFFFADAVILVEGSGERILMPKFLENEKMPTNYISIIEINGSHAHRFRNLVEKLDIPCLVITDIDAYSNGIGSVPTMKGKKQISKNSTLKEWLPKKENIDERIFGWIMEDCGENFTG